MTFQLPPIPASDLRPLTSSSVVVLLGPVRSGKTHELIGQSRAALEQAPRTSFDRSLWLAPNGRTAAGVRDALVRRGLSACLTPGVLTFEDLTHQVLAASGA